MLVERTNLDIVDALYIREVSMNARVRKRSILRDRLVLDWPKIRQRVVARIVVVSVFPYKRAKGKDRVRSSDPRIGRCDIEA